MCQSIKAFLGRISLKPRVATIYTALYLGISSIVFIKSSRIFPIITYDGGEYAASFIYFLKTGIYFPDTRMPGYGIPFTIWYALTEDYMASMTFMAVFYGIFCTIGIYMSIYLMSKYFHNMYLTHLFGLSWTASIAVEWWWLFPDPSIAVAVALALSLMMYDKPFLSGFFQLISFVLRPINLLLYPVSAIFLLFKSTSISAWLRKVSYVLLPFVVYEAVWILRNYGIYGDFRPLYGNRAYYHEPQMSTYCIYGTRMAHSLGLNHEFISGRGFDYIRLEKSLPYFLSAYSYLDSITVNALSIFFGLYEAPLAFPEKECEYERKIAIMYDSLSSLVKLPRPVIALRALYFGAFGLPYGFHIQNEYISYQGVFFLTAFFLSNLLMLFAIAVALSKKSKESIFALMILLYATTVPWAHAILGIVERRYLLIWTPIMMMAIGIAAEILRPAKRNEHK